ncbi:MAG: EAL domain-containing protein [Mesorhizobium sp.]
MSGIAGAYLGNREKDDALADPLTGLGNQHRFADELERLRCQRSGTDSPFAIGIIDLDGFKPINDLFGRAAGDDILSQAGMRLSAAMNGQSLVARLGADEFAILLPTAASEQEAISQVQMLIEILSAPYDVGGRTARLSASVGCALFYGEQSSEELISMAETAIYHAKRSGRGKVVVYTQQMEDAAKRVTRIEQALRRAVSAGEVEPFFQPIVSLATREVKGFEALSRWTDRELGPVAPSVFIAIAEERGIIGPLSQLVLRKAVEAAMAWPPHLYLSFNLSPSQLVDGNTGVQILSTLDATGFDPRRLEIEITETGVMSDPVSAWKIIEELRAMGVRVSLDDFGTGQSSLGRLREFRFDKLKIDRAFVASMFEDRPSEHIVRAILAMCEGLGMDVVAEGIEVEGQARRLMQFGCSSGQGYLFGKPADARTTLANLRAPAKAPPRYSVL